MAKREYAPETKAAVMAALLEGQSISGVARQYKIPKGTVSGWSRQAGTLARASGTGTVATQKRQGQIQELVLDLLVAQLRSQVAIAKHGTDKAWLNKQDASSLAVFYGVGNDKVFRLLEALGNAGSEPESAEG
jgi:transposase-like protein